MSFADYFRRIEALDCSLRMILLPTGNLALYAKHFRTGETEVVVIISAEQLKSEKLWRAKDFQKGVKLG